MKMCPKWSKCIEDFGSVGLDFTLNIIIEVRSKNNLNSVENSTNNFYMTIQDKELTNFCLMGSDNLFLINLHLYIWSYKT